MSQVPTGKFRVTDLVKMEAEDAVNALPPATGGSDGPESYSRALYEAYSDPAIGWRPGSRRLLVNFGRGEHAIAQRPCGSTEADHDACDSE